MTDEEIGIGDKENLKKFSATFDRKTKESLAKFDLEQNAAKRDERLRNNMLWAAIIFFWFLLTILAAAVFIFAWHKLVPVHWEFLMPDKVGSIQTFLLSGALTAFLSSVGRSLVSRYTNTKSNSSS